MTIRIVGIDTETTDLDPLAGAQIIEICMAVYQSDNGIDFTAVGKPWTQRIKPTVPINPKAQEVHGISLADLREAPTWDKVAPRVQKILRLCDVAVAHNADFDMTFLAVELSREKVELPDLEVYCTMSTSRDCTAMGKLPSLKEFCWAYDVPYDEGTAHAADYDVEVMMKALFRAIKQGRAVLPQIKVKKMENAA